MFILRWYLLRHAERARFYQTRGGISRTQTLGVGDPSLRLKNGSARDDAVETGLTSHA
jgi:hypothetical protein